VLAGGASGAAGKANKAGQMGDRGSSLPGFMSPRYVKAEKVACRKKIIIFATICIFIKLMT